MAMIDCSECGAHISDKAQMCVKCGAPVINMVTAVDQVGSPDVSTAQPVVVTEQTGKAFKGLQVLGVIIFLAGMVSCSESSMGVTAALWGVGTVIYVGARFGAWWNHG